MDVDGPCDEKLLHAFRTMNTEDKEVLVNEFRRVVSQAGHTTGITDRTAEFFLEMNDWNLQSALCSYYDLGTEEIKLPTMAFVKDVTIGEGESVPPNTRFTKTWRISNPGPDQWPAGCALVFIEGEPMSTVDRIWVDTLQAGCEVDLSIDMISPKEQSIYQSRWHMVTPNGIPFGEPIWCIIVVENSGLLSLTQRLASASCVETGASNKPHLFAANTPSLLNGDAFAAAAGNSSRSNNPFGLFAAASGRQSPLARINNAYANLHCSSPISSAAECAQQQSNSEGSRSFVPKGYQQHVRSPFEESQGATSSLNSAIQFGQTADFTRILHLSPSQYPSSEDSSPVKDKMQRTSLVTQSSPLCSPGRFGSVSNETGNADDLLNTSGASDSNGGSSNNLNPSGNYANAVLNSSLVALRGSPSPQLSDYEAPGVPANSSASLYAAISRALPSYEQYTHVQNRSIAIPHAQQQQQAAFSSDGVDWSQTIPAVPPSTPVNSSFLAAAMTNAAEDVHGQQHNSHSCPSLVFAETNRQQQQRGAGDSDARASEQAGFCEDMQL